MASYPSKPWSDGQTYEVVPGEVFVYNATQSVWQHQTKATLDSDYQVDKTAIEADITTNASDISTLQTRATAIEADIDSEHVLIKALEARVDTVELLSDSEAGRVQSNIDKINTAFAMLDSDSLNIQQIRTDLDAEVAATNADVTAITARLDSDEVALQSLQTQVDALVVQDGVTLADHDSDITALPMPVISATQPTGKEGLLWVNLNDGKMYYWNTTAEVFTSIVAE